MSKLKVGDRVAIDNFLLGSSEGSVTAVNEDGRVSIDWDDGFVDLPDDIWYETNEVRKL